MKKQRQIEEAARLDGMYDAVVMTGAKPAGLLQDGSWVCLPDYLTDYNAVHRLIAGMSTPDNHGDDNTSPELDLYDHYLQLAIKSTWRIMQHQATCAQMLEATLKAYGKWEDGE